MSVATEFPPAVYIPERARPATGGAPRHLALVPGRIGGAPAALLASWLARPVLDRRAGSVTAASTGR